MAERTFHPADYVVFSAMLLISLGIGIYYAIAGGKQKSTREFLMADRSMSSLPVALSVLASFFSASTLLGTPAEIYQYGTQYWMCVFGTVFAPITGALLFGPMFFNLKIVSVFEYLELRFKSRAVRLFAAFLFLIRTTLGMGIVLFGPSTALAAVTEVPVWAIILILGSVCTMYTTLGGLKAVIWTDVFQTLVMLTGMLAVFIQGSIRVGGIKEMWRLAEEGDRIEFFNFDPDPHVRHTFWSLVVGIYFVWLPPYTVDQQMVQRFSSARSLKDAKFALYCNVPGMFILITLCSVVGLTVYANYAKCDPLMNQELQNANQLLPFFVMDVFHDLPGLPGLFVASLFSGALSSVSSMLNSLAAVTWEDFLKLKYSDVTDQTATKVTRGLGMLFGCLGVGMAFAVEKMGGTVLQASLTFNGAIGAPLVGVFILGACFTSTNWMGAIAGGLFGLAFPMWLGIGKYVTHPQNFKLPTSIDGCNRTYVNHTETSILPKHNAATASSQMLATVESSPTHQELEGLGKLYGISYIWFSALGVLTAVVIGLLVSVATGRMRNEEVHENLQLHIVKKMSSACFCKDEDKQQTGRGNKTERYVASKSGVQLDDIDQIQTHLFD